VNKIDYLIVSSTIDFSTDMVCYRLLEDNEKFYRLNRDEFLKHKIVVDLQNEVMIISIDGEEYEAQFEHLKGIFFRAPVFLRTQSKKELSVQEQLERNQWSSFLRNLIVFKNANWINNPVSTYRAENKIFQLCIAKEYGLEVPVTYISNCTDFNLESDKKYIVKSLDTALFYDMENNKEMFTYSNVVSGSELNEYDLTSAPIFIQEFLNPKIDCRVTYVQGKLFPVKILQNGKGLYGDWRMRKEELEYIPFQLPTYVENAIHKLMKKLELNFGGIDLAIVSGEYYFIEVNPTGEWGWLEVKTGTNISKTIKRALAGDKVC
jgi:glutathione synthase/RimK-type ligase-like ATP-grasp enzyme